MSFDLDTLYNLLPAIYRRRDAQSRAIRGLLAVIQREVAVLEEDLAQRYDDEFVETSAEWVVPYIGDLLGVRGLHPIPDVTFSQRAYVANTISYRRRKGTVAVLERLARDVTGWPANAVEFFQVLAATQYLNHQRLTSLATADLRKWEPLERVDSPFDRLAHTVDTRQIVSRRGRYNIPNVGIFLWRLKPFSLTDSPAVRVDGQRFVFSPLGNNLQLMMIPPPQTDLTQLVTPFEVPTPISRRVLEADLGRYYGSGQSVLIKAGGQSEPVDQIKVCDLRDLVDGSGTVIGWAHVPTDPNDKIAVDPVLGRIAFPTNQGATPVHVTFHYGFGYELGGGEYERTFAEDAVGAPLPISVPRDQATIQGAINASAGDTRIEIDDSGRYDEALAINLAAGQRLEIRAGNGHSPTIVLRGDLGVVAATNTSLTLDGLRIVGGDVQISGPLDTLRLDHCTLVPGRVIQPDGTPVSPDLPSLVVGGASAKPTAVTIDHSIVGPLRLPAELTTLTILDSIVDSPRHLAPAQHVPVLVSGQLNPFPVLSSPTPTVQMTIGGDGPYMVTLAGVPANLADAATQLEAAIQAASANPAFAKARVVVTELRLFILPGLPERISITSTGTDPTATELMLSRSAAQFVFALVGGPLPSTLVIRSNNPTVAVTMEADGPYQVPLTIPITNPAEARDRLQAAIRNAHPTPAFNNSFVLLVDDGLVVVPGETNIAVTLGLASGDATTLDDLALTSEPPAIAASDAGDLPGPDSTIERCTIFGPVHVRDLVLATDTIFNSQVVSDHRQEGCVRYSYVPIGSETPRRYLCQPAEDGSSSVPPKPDFTSRRFGDPGYGQLTRSCPDAIRLGACDGASMGAFHNLFEPQRESNLRVALEEYLRFGLEAGIFMAT